MDSPLVTASWLVFPSSRMPRALARPWPILVELLGMAVAFEVDRGLRGECGLERGVICAGSMGMQGYITRKRARV